MIGIRARRINDAQEVERVSLAGTEGQLRVDLVDELQESLAVLFLERVTREILRNVPRVLDTVRADEVHAVRVAPNVRLIHGHIVHVTLAAKSREFNVTVPNVVNAIR